MEHQSQSTIPGLMLTEVLDNRRNQVWLAVDLASDTSVAVKFLNAAYEAILPKRFGPSGRALTKIMAGTTGWVPLLETGVATDGRQYVTMPYYRAGSLADQLEHGSTPWYPAASLLVNVASTIGRAHNLGWSFGRLRPSNVILESADNPLVAVYGSSTRRFDDGTAQFTAPEVAASQPPLPASDVYSLCLVLASLIAGREVDCSESPQAVLAELHGQAPDRIIEILEYGLSPSLQNRYADATKLAGALAAAVAEPARSRETLSGVEARTGTRREQARNPLDALLAEPLIQPQADNSEEVTAAGSSSKFEADVVTIHPDSEDETSLPWAGPDDDTAPPGFDGRLDDPTANPFLVDQGPLSDLLTPTVSSGPVFVRTPADAVDDPDPTMNDRDGSETRDEINQLIDQLGLQRPTTGSLDKGTTSSKPDLVEDSPSIHHNRSALKIGAGKPSGQSFLTKLLQEVTVHRHRIASSVTILALTAIVVVGVMATFEAVRSNATEASEGSPGASLTNSNGDNATSADLRSPLNNLDHLDDIKSVQVQTTTAPVRRRATSSPTDASSSTTTSPDSGGSTPESTDTTIGDGSQPDQTTSTAQDSSTTTPDDSRPTSISSTTTRPSTTTTVQSTSTTKRRGRPPRP